jgi:spore coat protein H
MDLMPTAFGRPPGGGTTIGTGGPPGMNLQGRDGQRNGLSGMAGLDFEYVHADLEFDGKKFSDIAVRYKGNGTYMDARNSEKKSLKVDLNEFVKGQKLNGHTTLNFHNNITDPAWMNESLAYALYRDAGVPAARTSYTRLSITVPGTYDHKYFGLYALVENPDKNWTKDRFDSKKGAILKPVTRELFVYKGADWSAYRQAYDAKTDITDKQMRRVIDFAKLVSTATDEEFATKLPEFLDIDQFARFMAVTVWLSSTDSILMVGQNYIVHLDSETKKFVFAPWDLDRAFGNFFVPDPEQLAIGKAWGEDNRFLTRVMNVPAVRDAYMKRMEEFQKTIFEPTKLLNCIEEIAAVIRPAVAEEGPEKAERFDKSLAETEAAPAPEPAGSSFGFRMPGARKIKLFIKARHKSVADQLAGKSEGRPLSGGFPGMGPGRGGEGGPGSGGRPGQAGQPQGTPRFGPGMFLGPTWTKAADADTNGQITIAEFQGLSSRWVGEWDADNNGSLNEAELREGLAKAFPAPNFGAQPSATPITR